MKKKRRKFTWHNVEIRTIIHFKNLEGEDIGSSEIFHIRGDEYNKKIADQINNKNRHEFLSFTDINGDYYAYRWENVNYLQSDGKLICEEETNE